MYCWSDLWFAKWVYNIQTISNTTEIHSSGYYMRTYGLAVAVSILCGGAQSSLYAISVSLSARRHHNKMFAKLLRLPQRFFDTNPSGKTRVYQP